MPGVRRDNSNDQDDQPDTQDQGGGLEPSGTDVDWDNLRAEVYRTHTKYDEKTRRTGVRCVWCGEITYTADLHEALVKRSAVHKSRQHLIFVKTNVVPVCHDEHLEYGQSKEMVRRALDALCHRVGARRVGKWYVSLWEEHGLSVPKGLLVPRKMIPGHRIIHHLETGAKLSNTVLPETDDWNVKTPRGGTTDWRVWVATKRFMNYNPRWASGRLVTEKNGLRADTAVLLIEDGYYYDYLTGIFA